MKINNAHHCGRVEADAAQAAGASRQTTGAGRYATSSHPANVTNRKLLKVKTIFQTPTKGLKTQENEDGRRPVRAPISNLLSSIFHPQSEVNRTQNNEKQ